MKRALTSLVAFAFAGFIFSSGLMMFERSVLSVNNAVFGTPHSNTLVAYN